MVFAELSERTEIAATTLRHRRLPLTTDKWGRRKNRLEAITLHRNILYLIVRAHLNITNGSPLLGREAIIYPSRTLPSALCILARAAADPITRVDERGQAIQTAPSSTSGLGSARYQFGDSRRASSLISNHGR